MSDIYSPEKRSEIMASIGAANTKPELIVHRALRRTRRRFVCHPSDLPGRPDIILRRAKKAIFVHGCFWHQHPRCRRAIVPATNRRWWKAKLEATRRRDTRTVRSLRRLGWSVLVLWECQLRHEGRLVQRIHNFIAP